MKKKIYTVIALLMPVAIVLSILSAGYYIYYLWWGQRHSVLYDVDTVYVEQSEENEDIYYLTYEVSVKNWCFDFEKHTYKLKNSLVGSPGAWHFKGESDYFTSRNFIKSNFDITVEFDITTYDGNEDDVIADAITTARFAAYDEEGNKVESATLFMNDFVKSKIVYGPRP